MTVNDVVILDPFFEINPKKDIVRFDDQIIKFNQELSTIVLNKPKGFVCSKNDELNRKTVFDLIPRKPSLNYVGRLDKDTTGLILFTNNGKLSDFLTHPRYKITKEYLAETATRIKDSDIKKIEKGIFIGSGDRGRAKILYQKKIKNTFFINMILRQGKKNEIRRIFKFSNIKLISLKRIKFGEITLGNLNEGSWRELSKKENKYLEKISRK